MSNWPYPPTEPQQCAALDMDGARCQNTGTRPRSYHGDDEIYSGTNVTWVRVWLCPKHDPHKGRQ